MERKRWKVGLLAAALVCGGAQAAGSGTYKLIHSGYPATCPKIMAALVKDVPPKKDGICKWTPSFRSNDPHVSLLNWAAFSPTEAQIRDMRLIMRRQFDKSGGLSKVETEALWQGGERAKWLAEKQKNGYSYYRAKVDLDNDDDTEDLVMETRERCEDYLESPVSPRIYVLDGDQVALHYATYDNNYFVPVLIDGKTHILRVIGNYDEKKIGDGRQKRNYNDPLLITVSLPNVPDDTASMFVPSDPICKISVKK